MYTLESIPENKTIINNIPPNNILNVVFPSTTGVSMSVPLILDGWGHPILFVPGGGFGRNVPNTSSGSFPYSVPGVVCIDVTTGNNIVNGIVTSAGMITSTSTIPLATYDARKPPTGAMLSNQPFFVSAGPDGKFDNYANYTNSSTNTTTQSDDNIYSFK
jgi:hypothetical protein